MRSRSPYPIPLPTLLWAVVWRVSLVFALVALFALLAIGCSGPTEPRKVALDYGSCAPFDSLAWAGYLGTPDSVAQRYPKVVAWIFGAPPASSAETYVFNGKDPSCVVYSITYSGEVVP